MSGYLYTAYGLIIESMIPLADLLKGKGSPDVVIDYGDVPANLPGADVATPVFQAREDRLLLMAPEVARFLIRNGDEIVVQPLPGSEVRDHAVYLVGVCMAVVLHQRGILALHASAIKALDSAFLFAGPSRSGKSTLLGVFLQRGYSMLTDDVAAIVLNSRGLPVILPAIPRLKLWEDAAAELGIDTDPLQQVYSKEHKYAVPTRTQFVCGPETISHIFLLAPYAGDRMMISPLTGWERIDLLIQQTFRQTFLDGLNRRSTHLHLAAQIAGKVSFYRLDIPHSRFSTRDIARAIEDTFIVPSRRETSI